MTQRRALLRTAQAGSALLVLILVGCGAPAAIEREPPDEARLATRVKIALVEDPAIDAAAIFVDVNGDRVRLRGFVDALDEREQALRVARGVPGVGRVGSDIRIR